MRKFIPFVIVLFILLFCFGFFVYLHFYKSPPENEITLYGNVDVRQVDIGFRVYGRVESMPFEEGDFVPKGALLGTIEKEPYHDQVLEAKANLKAAELNWQNARQIFERRKELIGEGGVSQEDFENTLTTQNVNYETLEQTKAALGVALTNLNNTEVFCPADGVVLTRVREPGSMVLQGEPIYTISLISPVWIRAYVPEPLLGSISFGQTATIHTDTKNGKVYTGKIGFISPVAEFTPKTVETATLRTDLVYRIRVYADNPDWGLKQGMPVTIKLNPCDRQKIDETDSPRSSDESIQITRCP